jgi:hypothetical protein
MIKRNNQFQQPIAPAMGDRQVRFCRGGRIVTLQTFHEFDTRGEPYKWRIIAWCSIQYGSITTSATTGVTRATTGLRIGPSSTGASRSQPSRPTAGLTHATPTCAASKTRSHALTQLRCTPRTEGFGERHARGLRFTPEFQQFSLAEVYQCRRQWAHRYSPCRGRGSWLLFGCVDDQDVDPGFTGHVGGHRAQ